MLTLCHAQFFSIFYRQFNQNHLKGSKNWIRQIETLADRFDYTLLMECSENYVCEVGKLSLRTDIYRVVTKWLYLFKNFNC